MEDQDRCRDCGEKLPADAPAGLCPACLLRAGSSGSPPAEGEQGWHDAPDTAAERESPPSVAAKSAQGALATLAAKAHAAELSGPAIIVVGKVVTLRDKLDWRPAAESRSLVANGRSTAVSGKD